MRTEIFRKLRFRFNWIVSIGVTIKGKRKKIREGDFFVAKIVGWPIDPEDKRKLGRTNGVPYLRVCGHRRRVGVSVN